MTPSGSNLSASNPVQAHGQIDLIYHSSVFNSGFYNINNNNNNNNFINAASAGGTEEAEPEFL